MAVKTQSGRKKLVSIVAGTAISAISLLGASLARASTSISRQNGSRATTWAEIATSTGGAINISDATLTNGAGTPSRSDAFDGALNIYVGFDGGSETEMTIDSPGATVQNNSPNGGSVSGTASVGNLGMDWSLEFSSTAAQVLGTFVVTNNDTSAFDGYVAVKTNFGSDDDTVVEATSSGDATLADGDTWVVSSEASGESSGTDPIMLSVINNANAVIGPDTTLNDADDTLVWRVPVNLAPGASATIEASHCLFETIAEAQAAGLSGTCPDPRAIPVPVMQNPALLALAILTGLLGTGSLVSRKKKLQKK